jgi:subtilisin family serine protease
LGSNGAWWVFFRDKQIASVDQVRQLLGPYPSTHLSMSRRIRAGVMSDGLDVPVADEYTRAVEATGAHIRTHSRWLNAVSVEDLDLSAIMALPCVAGIAPVATGRVSPDPASQADAGPAAASTGVIFYPFNYGLALQQVMQLNVPEMHALGYSGENIRIAVFDTGFRTEHAAFADLLADGRIIAAYDFIYGDSVVANEEEDALQQDRHGTQVLSTITGFAPGDFVSPAYNAEFILAKTEFVAGETPVEEDYYVSALEWADSLGADIVTSSLSYNFGYVLDGAHAITSVAAMSAASRGILLCTAMGNSGSAPMSLGAPADAFGIVSVGAVDQLGLITAFSSRGPTADGRIKPEVCARGSSVWTVDPSSTTQYTPASGTSLSTPLVSSSAALLAEAHPDWAPVMLREALMQSGDHAVSPDNAYGWGTIDLLWALECTPFGALQLTEMGDSDRYEAGDWTMTVRSTGFRDRHPAQIMLHYSYVPGATDSVTMTHVSDSVWTASLPFTGESGLRYYYMVTDSAGRSSIFPPGAPAREFERLRSPDSLVDGFEFGGQRWERGGVGRLWWPSALDAAAGVFALTDSPSGSYDRDANAWIATKQPLIIAADVNMLLEFQSRFQLAAGDSGFTELQERPSEPWIAIDTVTGEQAAWLQRQYPLAASSGDSIRVRFRLKTDASAELDGWYIDDFRVGPGTLRAGDGTTVRPDGFRLSQNYPNPFNPETAIEFELLAPGSVSLAVYNVPGRCVRTLADRAVGAGTYRVVWDGTDDRGRQLPSGLYFYRLKSADVSLTRKMMLLR